MGMTKVDPRKSIIRLAHREGCVEGTSEFAAMVRKIARETFAFDMQRGILETRKISSAIREGKIGVSTLEGFLIIKDFEFDEIVAGRRIVSRDITSRTLTMLIGAKTVKFQRGPGKSATPAKQITFALKKVWFEALDGEKADPANVPDDFWATYIVAELGEELVRT